MRTPATWRLYSSVERTSVIGRTSLDAASATSARRRRSTLFPSTRLSHLLSLMGTGATAPAARRHLTHTSPSITTRAAAFIFAISWETLPILIKALPVPSWSRGMVIALSISPGLSTVAPGPLKKVSTGTSLFPSGPSTLTDASMTRRGGAQSADGAALQRFPPMVATFLTWGFARTHTAWCRAG